MARARGSGARGLLLRVLIVAGTVLVTTAASSHPPYRRAEWPHWIDADGDWATWQQRAHGESSCNPINAA